MPDPRAINLPDGSLFVPVGETLVPEGLPPIDPSCADANGAPDEALTIAWVRNLWNQAVLARQPEIERLRRLEMLYQGFHYKNPQHNRTLEITNYCFSTVETVWPILVEHRPRPEIVPRRPMDARLAWKIEEFANWWQDLGRVEQTRRVNTRALLKYGYCITLLTVDQDSGMVYAMDWSAFDYYPDPSARRVTDAEFFFFGAPIATRRLQAMFPERANDIVPDNIVSPAYDAVVRPFYELYAAGRGSGTAYWPLADNTESTSPYQGSHPSGTGAYTFSPSPDTAIHQGSDTTFFIQLLVRDYSTKRCVTEGKKIMPPPAGLEEPVEIPAWHEEDRPSCPSGWRMMFLTGNGKLLYQCPVDEDFGGLPFEMGFDYESELKIGGIGEIDQIASINAAYNERKNILNQALKYQGVPVLVSSKGSGLRFDAAGIQAGDVLEPTRGTDLRWLEYDGPSEHQFAMLQVEQRDIDSVGGVHDVQQGQRPAGIEAAAAIRELQAAAAVRVRGKVPGHQDHWARVLSKALSVLSKKLQAPIMFKASNGEMVSITPEELQEQYSIRFAEGSATLSARREEEEKYKELFAMGVLPPGELLKALQIKDHERIAATMALNQMRAPPTNGNENGGGTPKKKAKAGAGR